MKHTQAVTYSEWTP